MPAGAVAQLICIHRRTVEPPQCIHTLGRVRLCARRHGTSVGRRLAPGSSAIFGNALHLVMWQGTSPQPPMPDNNLPLSRSGAQVSGYLGVSAPKSGRAPQIDHQIVHGGQRNSAAALCVAAAELWISLISEDGPKLQQLTCTASLCPTLPSHPSSHPAIPPCRLTLSSHPAVPPFVTPGRPTL
eukprot:365062-Chlamydomonas_euryale.AAC.3